MTSVAKRLITAEEFWMMPGHEHMELVRGEVVRSMPPGKDHGAIALKIGSILLRWVEGGARGTVGVESGFMLSHDPDVLRGPDVYYVSAERAKLDDASRAFWTVAPDLAVEVISPGETVEGVREKVRDFLGAGTPLVWLVFTNTKEVVVHTPDGLARTYGENDVIEYGDVLPGFSCKVGELFQ